jgi:hypothetical protein
VGFQAINLRDMFQRPPHFARAVGNALVAFAEFSTLRTSGDDQPPMSRS